LRQDRKKEISDNLRKESKKRGRERKVYEEGKGKIVLRRNEKE
jgi:hypothetical protein